MADAVKRIGIQFILENIKDVSKTLKEIGQDNKVQLSVEFKDKKSIKNAISKLNEELSSNFAEGINIGSLLGDALATGNLQEAVKNVNGLRDALSLLNKQIGVSGDAFKSKIASLNNQQVAELLQASSAINKNSEIKNKQEAIQNKIDSFSVKGNLELTQKIEQSLDKISNNIEAIRKVTDDIGKGKIGEVLNEQAKGFDKVRESAEGASEAFEEYNNKQAEFNQVGGTEKGKKGKNNKSNNSNNNNQPQVAAGESTGGELDEENARVARIQAVLKKHNEVLNLSRVKKDDTLIQKFDSENKAITESIKLLQEEGYALEEISKIYPKLIRGYTLWQEAQRNKGGNIVSSNTTNGNVVPTTSTSSNTDEINAQTFADLKVIILNLAKAEARQYDYVERTKHHKNVPELSLGEDNTGVINKYLSQKQAVIDKGVLSADQLMEIEKIYSEKLIEAKNLRNQNIESEISGLKAQKQLYEMNEIAQEKIAFGDFKGYREYIISIQDKLKELNEILDINIGDTIDTLNYGEDGQAIGFIDSEIVAKNEMNILKEALGDVNDSYKYHTKGKDGKTLENIEKVFAEYNETIKAVRQRLVELANEGVKEASDLLNNKFFNKEKFIADERENTLSRAKNEVSNIQQNLKDVNNIEEYTQKYNEASVGIEQLKKELIGLGIETEKVNSIFSGIKTPEAWEEARKQAEEYKIAQEEANKQGNRIAIRRRIVPVSQDSSIEISKQKEQSNIDQKVIDDYIEKANAIKKRLELRTEDYEPLTQKDYAEKYKKEKEGIEQLKKELEELGVESSKIEEILSRIRKPEEWNEIAREVRAQKKFDKEVPQEKMGESDDIVASQYAGARTTVTRAEDDFSNVTADAIDSERGMINNLEAENEELNEVVNQLMESNNTLSQLATQDINSNTTSLASKYNNLEAKYKEAVQTIKRNIDEYYRIIEETGQEPDFEGLGLTNIDEDGNILDSAKNKIIENVKQKITNINSELEQIKDPTEFQKKYESLQSLITNIKGLLSSLEVKDIDGLFGSDNFNLEKALEIRKKALEQIEKEREKVPETSPAQTQRRSNIVMMDNNASAQAYSTDAPVQEQQKLENAVNETTEALEQQAEISAQTSQIVANNAENGTKTEEQAKFIVGGSNYIPIITEGMNEANKDLAKEIESILKIYAESRGIKGANDKAKEYIERYFKSQDIIAGYKEDFKEMSYTDKSGNVIEGAKVLETGKKINIQSFAITKILDFYKELTEITDIINSQESSEEDITQAKAQAENIKGKILGLVDIYTSYGGKDLVDRLTTELGKDSFIDEGSLEQITNTFQTFINEIIIEKDKIRNLGEQVKNIIAQKSNLGSNEDIRDTSAYTGEVYNLTDILNRKYGINLTGKAAEKERQMITSLFPQAKSTTRFFGEEDIEGQKIFEEIKRILIETIEKALNNSKTSEAKKQQYREYLKALRQEGNEAAQEAVARTQESSSQQNQKDSVQLTPQPIPTEVAGSAIETAKAVTGEGNAAETASVQFNDLTEAKKAFALANQEARGSAEATAEAILKEGQASETASATMEGAIKKGQEILEKLKQNNTNIKILSPKDVLDNTSSIASTITEVKRKTNSIRGISKTHFVRNNNEDVPEAKIAKSTEMAEDTLQKSLALLATNPIDFSTLLNEAEEKLNTLNQLKDIVKVFQGKETKVEGLKGLSEEDLVDKIREEMNVFLDNRKAIDTALIDLEKGEEVDLQAKIIEYRKSQIRVQKMMQQLINKNGGKTDAEGDKRTYLQTTEDIIGKYWGNETSLFEGYLKDFEGIYNPATDKFRSAEEIGLQIFKYNKEDFNNLQEYYGNLKKIIDYITEHQSEIIAKAVELNNALQGKGLKEEKPLASQPQSSNQISEKNQPVQTIQPAQEKPQPVLASTPVVQAREDVGQIEGEAEQIKNETEQAKAEAEQARIEAEQARRMAEQAERTAKRTLAILDKINSIRNEIASKRTKGTQLDLNTVIAKKNKIAESIRDLDSKKTIQEIASSSLNPKDISTLKVQNSRDEIESDIQAQLSKEGVLEILKSLLQSKQDELAPMEERMKSFTQSLNESKLKGVSKLTSDELIKQIDASLETMRGLYDNDQRESQDFLFEQLKVVQLIRQMYNRGYGKKELGVGNDKEAVQKILSDLYYEGKIKADESTIGLMSDFKNIGNKRTGTFKSYDAIINDTIAKEYGGSIQQKQNDIADLITIINYIESHLTNLSEMRQVLESGNITKLPTDNLQKYEEQKQKELEVASQNQPKNQTAEVVEQSRESAEQANAIVEQAKQTAEQVLSIWDKINEIKNTIASGRNLDSQLTFNDILTDNKKRKGVVESIKGLDSKETIKEMVDSGMRIREISDYHTQRIQGSRDEIENDIQAQLSKEGLLALLKSTLKSRQDKVASMEQYLDNVRQSFNDSKIKGISKLSLDELIKQIDTSLGIMREMYENDEQGSQDYLFEQLKVAQSIRQMYTRGYGKKEIGAENDKEAIQKILTYLFEEGRIEADKSTIGLMSDFRNIGNESTNNLMSNEGIIKKQNSKQFAYIAQAKDEMADLITIIDYIESHLDSISTMRSILEFGNNVSKQQDTTQTADVVEQSKESAKQAEIIVEEARQTAERTLAIWDKINEIRNTIASGRTLDSQLTFTDITNEENGINRIGNTIKSLKSTPSVQDIVKSGVNIDAITEEMVRNSREEIERELNTQLSNEDLLGFFKTALKRRQNTAPNIESGINSFIEDFNNAKIEGVSKKSSDELIKQIDDSLRIMGELYDNNQQKSQDFVFEQLKIVQSIRQLYKKGYDKGSLYANNDEEATQKILNNLYEEGKIGADINTVSLMSRYFNNVGNSKTGNFATYDEMINKQVGQDMKSLQNVMEEISNLMTIIDYIENHLASLSTARRFLESGNITKLPTDNLQKYQEEQKREEEQRKREEQEREEKRKRQEEYNNILSRMDEDQERQRIDAKNSLERFNKDENQQVPIVTEPKPEQTEAIIKTADAVEKVNEAVEHASEQADKPILNLEDERQEVEQLAQAVNNFADSLGIVHGNVANTNVSGTAPFIVGNSVSNNSTVDNSINPSENIVNPESSLNILASLSSLTSTLDEASIEVVKNLSGRIMELGRQIEDIQSKISNFKFSEESLESLKKFKETLEAISNSVITIVDKGKNLPSIARQVNQNNVLKGQEEEKATKLRFNTDDTIKEDLKRDLKTLTGRGATSLFARETLREKRRNFAEEGQELFNPKDITNLEKADALYEKVTKRISELKEHGKTEILNDPEIKALLEERETQIRNAYIGKINKNINQGKIGVEEKIQTEQDAELAKIKEIESAYSRLRELASPLAVNEEYLTSGQATNAMAKVYNQQSKEFLKLQKIIGSEETQKLIEAGKISPEVISSYEEAIAKAKERQEEIRKEIQLLQEKAQLESETKEYNSQVQQVESVYKELMGIVGNGRDFNIFQKASELENGTDTSQTTAKKINRYGQLTAYLESVRDADAERIAQGQTPIMAGVSEEVIKNYQTALEFAEKLYEKTVATEEAMKRQAERQEQYNALMARMDKTKEEEKQDSKDSWKRYKDRTDLEEDRRKEEEKRRKQEEAENKQVEALERDIAAQKEAEIKKHQAKEESRVLAEIAEERKREEQAFNEDTKTATDFYKQLISSEEEYLKLLQQEREGKLNPKENGELTDTQKKNRLKLTEYRKMRETDENGEYLALNEIQGKDWRKVSDVNNLRKEYQTKKENLHQAGYMADEEAEIAKVNAAYQVLIKTQEQYLRLKTKEKDGQALTKKEVNDLQKLVEERKKAWGIINETKGNNPNVFKEESVIAKQSQYAENKTQAKQAVDNSKIIEEISSLYDKMYKARNELSKLVSDSMVGKGDSDAIKKKQQEIDEYTKKIHEATEALRENEALYQQAQDVKLYYEEDENGEFKRRNNVNTPSNKLTSNLQSTFTNLTGLYQEYSGSEYIHQGEYLNTLEQQAERIAEILVDIKNNPIDITKKEDLKRLQEYNEELTQMDAKIKKDKKEASGFKQANGTKLARNITDFLSKNHGISEEASTTLRGQLTRIDNGVNIKELREIGQVYEDIKRQEIEAGRTGMTFFDTLKQRAQGLTATLATYVSFWRIISTVKQGFNTFKQFDSALAEMQKVSNETISTLKEFQQASFDLADSIGTDALSLQQSVAEFMRLGQSLEEATDSAQAANILFNVSEFESAKDASTALIAMSQAYDELSNTQIIDVINKLGNDFPISTEGLATALQDGAASLTTAGNDFYEAAALVTAGMILCLKNMETYFYRTHLTALIA